MTDAELFRLAVSLANLALALTLLAMLRRFIARLRRLEQMHSRGPESRIVINGPGPVSDELVREIRDGVARALRQEGRRG